MTISRRTLHILVPLALLISIVIAPFAYSIRVATQANEILTTAFQLTTAKNPSDAFAAIRQKYGKRLRALDGCSSSHCTYEVSVDNLLLSELHVVPYTELTSWFQLKDGQLVFSMMEYRTALKGTESPVVHVQTDFCRDEACGWVFLNPWSKSSPLRSNGIVEAGYTAVLQRRREAYGLNIRCLYTIGGCKDTAALLPSVWSRTANGDVSCLIPNDRGMTDWCREAEQNASTENCH